jgi:hypothetical protein
VITDSISQSIAVHAVLIKTSLPYVDGSPTKLSYWSNLGAAVLLISTALLKGEVTEFLMKTQNLQWDWSTFAWGNLVTGVVGFLISVAGILSVKVTSPVTHMFSSVSIQRNSVFSVLSSFILIGCKKCFASDAWSQNFWRRSHSVSYTTCFFSFCMVISIAQATRCINSYHLMRYIVSLWAHYLNFSSSFR